jgi:hypothetical protein
MPDRFSMRGEGLAPARMRHALALFLIWLVGSALLIMLFRDAIAARLFYDPDDYMRLQEVRDWMAGQSWFDVTQYRFGSASGLPMHWSRLVDVPIAATILLLRPLLGAADAETTACVFVPLVTLGIIGLLTAAIARRLLGPIAALAAMAACMINPELLFAARPMRIDHHGWQVVCAMAMALALIGNSSARRAIVAGLCAALWMDVSLEGMVFTAACGAWLGLRWIASPAEERRLPTYLAAAAGGGLLLFLAAHGGRLFDRTFCDAVSPIHLALFALAATGSAIALWLSPASWWLRAAALACCALLCGAVYRLGAPQCAGGPFAALDPLAYRLWYMTISEGLPIWKQTPQAAAMAIAYPLIGLAGAMLGWRRASAGMRGAWLDLIALLAAATLIGVLLMRASTVSNTLAVPGAFAMVAAAVDRTRTWRRTAPRVATLAGSVLIAMPLTVGMTAIAMVPTARAPDKARGAAIATLSDCMAPANLATLDRLPPSLMLSPLDAAPALIASSRHRAVAGPYQRDPLALHDVLAIFTADPATARTLIATRAPAYLFYCPGDTDLALLAGAAPHGLAAALDRGAPPAWLRSVPVAGLRYGRLFAINR